MRLSSYFWLLIACCFCSVASCFEDEDDEFPIEMGSFVRSSHDEQSGTTREEEEDIECAKKCSNLSQLGKRSANSEEFPIVTHENPMKVEEKASGKKLKKSRRFRTKNKNGKRRRKSKSSKKNAAIPPVIPSMFLEDLKMGMPVNNPEMSAPSSESSIHALPGKESGFLNLTDPTKEQFRVEKKKNFASFISDGLHAMQSSLNDNFGMQVPTKLFVGDKKIGFIEGLAERKSIEEEAKQLKQVASVPTEPEKAEKPSRKAERENIELTMQIVDLLTDLNVNTEDPENFTKSLKEINSNLISLRPKQQNTQS